MIPIDDLLRDGCWLRCTTKNRWTKDTDEWTFRMRILSFERLDYSQVDRPEIRDSIPEGVLCWLMTVEVVNTTKVSVLFGYLKQQMRLVDCDGFQFEDDDCGLYFSDFAKKTGLSLGSLLPKVKARGAVIFKVPDEDTNYSLAIKDGTMEEL